MRIERIGMSLGSKSIVESSGGKTVKSYQDNGSEENRD